MSPSGAKEPTETPEADEPEDQDVATEETPEPETAPADADAAEIPLPQAEWGEARPHGRQILSGSHNMDGFYYALLSRAAEK